MKAAVRSAYGPPVILSIREIDKPVPADNEVLVKVHATTVNRTDCAILTGQPFPMRFFTGLLEPALPVTGTDFAGEIEAAGKSVTAFKPGDKVMGFAGFGLSSHAQYMVMQQTKAIVSMPVNVNYEQAAACIEGAFYALDCVDMAKPLSGQKALVYGATGAIGSSIVQFLKYYGVYVSAVCGAENTALITALDADRVIDYKATDFTKDNERYDVVFDAVGKSSFAKCKVLLKDKGFYISTEPQIKELLATAFSRGKKVLFRPPRNLKARLLFITALVEQGKFRPVIDRVYPLEKIADAFSYVASGQKIGNVVISMDV